ncbi:MAG: acyloxyacyl hydrolase [Candidatus Korobacteraceae bacterium]
MRTQRLAFRGCILILLWIVPGVAGAQTSARYPLADNQLWEFGVWGAEAMGKQESEGFGETQITMAGFQISRVVYERRMETGKRTLEYTFEAQPLFLVTRRKAAYGGGFSPVGLKLNFVPRGRYRPYLEFNGGGMFTQKNVPPGPTSMFNFTLAAGPGVMIGLPHNQAMSIALRFWHLSNANLGDSNPAFNTIQIVIGYHWLRAGRTNGKMAAKPSTGGDAGTNPTARQ